jgi:hypothetical protein
MRDRSSVVTPGRAPASVSARRTRWRNVSWLMLSFAEIDSIAFHCDGYSPWCSNTIRTARSRTSSGYLPGRRFCSDICSASQENEQSPIPGRFNRASLRALERSNKVCARADHAPGAHNTRRRTNPSDSTWRVGNSAFVLGAFMFEHHGVVAVTHHSQVQDQLGADATIRSAVYGT